MNTDEKYAQESYFAIKPLHHPFFHSFPFLFTLFFLPFPFLSIPHHLLPHSSSNKGRGPSPTTNMKAASDLRQMLRSDATKKTAPPPPPAAKEVKRVETNDDDVGPFNFRQMLRKTNYAPTDTIRKRQLKRDGHNGYGAEYQM